MNSIETSGKTVEAAVKNGLKELGCESSDVNIDILEMGSPGLFGMFGKLARVRLTRKDKEDDFKIDMPVFSLDEQKTAKPAPKQEQKKPEPQKQEQRAQPKAEKPAVAQTQPKAENKAPAQREPKPERRESEKPQPEKRPLPQRQPKPEAATDGAQTATADAPRRERPPRRRNDRPERRREDAPATELEPIAINEPMPEVPFVAVDPEEYSDAASLAQEFLKNTTALMGVDVTIEICETPETMYVRMSGDALGVLIGRRGETLDALQYLASLQVNKGRDDYLRVSLDSENYRQKREEALRKLAARMAQRARKTGRRVALEPMNPYERRILHSALQGNPYVETHSEGEEPYRRVIITLK